MAYQGSRSANHLAFPVVLATVARTLELLFILHQNIESESLRQGDKHSLCKQSSLT